MAARCLIDVRMGVEREKVTRGNVYPINATTSGSLNTPIVHKPKD